MCHPSYVASYVDPCVSPAARRCLRIVVGLQPTSRAILAAVRRSASCCSRSHSMPIRNCGWRPGLEGIPCASRVRATDCRERPSLTAVARIERPSSCAVVIAMSSGPPLAPRTGRRATHSRSPARSGLNGSKPSALGLGCADGRIVLEPAVVLTVAEKNFLQDPELVAALQRSADHPERRRERPRIRRNSAA